MRKIFLIILPLLIVGNNAPVKAEIPKFVEENFFPLAMLTAFGSFFAYGIYNRFFYEEPTLKPLSKYTKLSAKKFLKVGTKVTDSISKRSQPIRDLLKKLDTCIQTNDLVLLATTINEINALSLILPIKKLIKKCEDLDLEIRIKVSRNYNNPKMITALYTLKTHVAEIHNNLQKFQDLCTKKEEQQTYSSSTSQSNCWSDRWHQKPHRYHRSKNTCDTKKARNCYNVNARYL